MSTSFEVLANAIEDTAAALERIADDVAAIRAVLEGRDQGPTKLRSKL